MQSCKAPACCKRHAYNGHGEQVAKYNDVGDANTTLTLYDEAGHWLGDYDANGNTKQQSIWLGDMPVGLVDAQQLYYVEADHLGTPRMVVEPQAQYRGVGVELKRRSIW